MYQTLYYLSDFNNYYNRQLKLPGRRLVEDYSDWVVVTTLPTNFNPNDGVDTVIDVNYDKLDDDIELDYLVTSQDNITVTSRWFVMERKRNLAGQWNLKLHRDMLADYFDSVMSCPAFIEKAKLSLGNKLIFNKENGINYNQIKTREELLTDETGCGWIVGYVAGSNINSHTITIPATGTSYPISPITWTDLQTYGRTGAYAVTDYAIDYTGTPFFADPIDRNREQWNFTVKGDHPQGLSSTAYRSELDVNNHDMITFNPENDMDTTRWKLGQAAYDWNDTLTEEANNYAAARLSGAKVDEATLNLLMNMNGNIYTSEGRTFKINCNINSTELHDYNLASSDGGLYTVAFEVLQESGTMDDFIGKGMGARIAYTEVTFTIDSRSIPQSTTTITNNARILNDAPYRMFCIPVGEPTVAISSVVRAFPQKQLAAQLATKIALELTDQVVYDVQYLPYCPMRSAITSVGGQGLINLEGLTENIDYNLLKTETDQIVQVILWNSVSNFTAFIPHRIDTPTDSTEFKIANETQFVRLCSPNYSGTFEFKPTMNYGVTGFEINCTYKPYQPYIHINPVFNRKGLYGGDFNDQRGLVCTGDFSMPMVTDAWKQYQLNNKSYYDSFNRQIENMETTYDINRKQQQIAGVIGAASAGLSGAAGGAMIGGTFGGPVGTAVGAIAGAATGVGSLVGLQADLYFADQLQQEALSFAKDNFGYQMQNIKALPYSLGRVSAFTINNKIFPFLEFYEATEEEVIALRNKLQYDGMTVMAATDYLGGYYTGGGFLQAQLIRYIPRQPWDVLDNHGVLALSRELHRGVYT